MISTAVFLAVLLLVQAGSGYTEKRDHKYDNSYIGDARIVAGFVYSMVVDISKETNDIFLSEMKSFEDIIEKNGYKTEHPGKETTDSLKQRVSNERTIKELLKRIRRANEDIVKLSLDRAHNCAHSAEACPAVKIFRKSVDDELKKVNMYMDSSYHDYLGHYLDDLENLCQGADKQIDDESEDALETVRAAGDERRSSAIDAIVKQVEILYNKLKDDEDASHHNHKEEVKEAVTFVANRGKVTKQEKKISYVILELRKSAHAEYLKIRRKVVVKRKLN